MGILKKECAAFSELLQRTTSNGRPMLAIRREGAQLTVTGLPAGFGKEARVFHAFEMEHLGVSLVFSYNGETMLLWLDPDTFRCLLDRSVITG